MNHFVSKIDSAFVAFCLFLMATVCSHAAEHSKTSIHVGIYAPFSNDRAYLGRNMLGAMEIARDQLKSSDIHYEFYTLDKISSPSQAEKTVQHFIDVHHIQVLVTESAESGAVAAPLASKNNIIHFCLSGNSVHTDGKNNFLAQSPNHRKHVVLTNTMKPEFITQFKQEYFSHPVTEAGYAFDILHLVHQSVVLAMKTNSDLSGQSIATHLLALESGSGVMGAFKLNKQGLSYKKQTLSA